jgi:hypothetical protein
MLSGALNAFSLCLPLPLDIFAYAAVYRVQFHYAMRLFRAWVTAIWGESL